MPSAFETAMAANLPSFYDEFSLTAAYTSPDGSTTSGLTIRVQRQDAREVDPAWRVSGEIQSAMVLVLQSALAKPGKGGRFTAETHEVWTILTTPLLKNGQHHCSCSRGGAERLLDRRAKE